MISIIKTGAILARLWADDVAKVRDMGDETLDSSTKSRGRLRMSRLRRWFVCLEKAAAYQKSDDHHILASFTGSVDTTAYPEEPETPARFIREITERCNRHGKVGSL
ncbi:hypothetical protein [Tardiphaga sp. 42S5]|uniref:hypothetical protein n=1 Tax=Tardiphaga sp. 42S5 TaxID=1404799 RepID=UPI002A59FB61|nr:hypothetical protein [Tardiphaga sp. 42S5]WPO43962.1 hypothetical protein SFY93_12755 [Tardiphaga sp. 42S5]